jgi:hypothetical protein
MKAKKILLVYVGILVFSLPPCHGQVGKWVERAAAIATKTAVEKAKEEANKTVNPFQNPDSLLYGYPRINAPLKPSPDSPITIALKEQNNPLESKIKTLSNSELLRIYYGWFVKGAPSNPTEETLKLVGKEIQSREFSLEDLTPSVLWQISEDNNAPEQLKSIVRRRIDMNENNFAHLLESTKAPSFPEENNFKYPNNVSVGMCIFIVLILFLIVLSIYYSYRHFKSNKPDRTFVVNNKGTIHRTFVVDDKGTICLQDEKIK